MLCNNGQNWYEGITDANINGLTSCHMWKMTCQYTGREFTAGCDTPPLGPMNINDTNSKYTQYDFFMARFPKDQLRAMVEHTSDNLAMAGKPPSTTGEILKWIGVTILIT